MIFSNMPTGIIYSNNPVIPQLGLSAGSFISFVLGSPILVQIVALPSSFCFIQEKNKESNEQKENEKNTSGYFKSNPS